MKRIGIVTATRAEYGLLSPLIRRIDKDSDLDLDLIVTGGHLSEKQGMTVNEIVEDGFFIAHRISILSDENTAFGISITMANAIRGFAECFRSDRPDMLVVLGDRTEMLGVASAAMNERIPIAHIHGGEVTEGAVDDCVRHVLTKMSYLHFTSTELYRRRVIQLGESPERVFNVGALGVENIRNAQIMTEDEFRFDLGIPKHIPFIVVTVHPETLIGDDTYGMAQELCEAMQIRDDMFCIITGSNADEGGERINKILKDYAVENSDNAIFIQSLGMKRYLSAMKYATLVVGNSSSGILEAPVFGTPTVNIGDRQKGRQMPDTIINCSSSKGDIVIAIDRALKLERKATTIYGDGNASSKIVEIIKMYLTKDRINLKKGFYDINSGKDENEVL